MSASGMTLDRLGLDLTMRALGNFIGMVGRGSRTYASAHPDEARDLEWERVEMVPQLLAAAVDEIRGLAWQHAQTHSKRNLSRYRPKPIPRPGVDDGSVRIGDGAIPVSEFDEWW